MSFKTVLNTVLHLLSVVRNIYLAPVHITIDISKASKTTVSNNMVCVTIIKATSNK